MDRYTSMILVGVVGRLIINFVYKDLISTLSNLNDNELSPFTGYSLGRCRQPRCLQWKSANLCELTQHKSTHVQRTRKLYTWKCKAVLRYCEQLLRCNPNAHVNRQWNTNVFLHMYIKIETSVICVSENLEHRIPIYNDKIITGECPRGVYPRGEWRALRHWNFKGERKKILEFLILFNVVQRQRPDGPDQTANCTGMLR